MENIEISCRLLKDIIRNANIGQDAVHFLLEKTNNPELQDELRNQEQQYLSVLKRAQEKLRTLCPISETFPPAAQNGMWMGAQLSTLIDARDMHLTGVTPLETEGRKPEIEMMLEQYAGAGAEAREIASELIRVEEANPMGEGALPPHQNIT